MLFQEVWNYNFVRNPTSSTSPWAGSGASWNAPGEAALIENIRGVGFTFNVAP